METRDFFFFIVILLLIFPEFGAFLTRNTCLLRDKNIFPRLHPTRKTCLVEESINQGRRRSIVALAAANHSSVEESINQGRRRSIVALAAASLVQRGLLKPFPRVTQGHNSSSELKPIAVLGCDGQTGVRVVDLVIAKGLPVRSIHHSPPLEKKTFIRGIPNQDLVAEIEDRSSLDDAIKGSRAVICVVGIQPKLQRGVIQDFDTGNDITTFTVGYANLAECCIKNKIPRLVILSSSCFYKSSTCESLNRGEETLQKIYSRAQEGLSYSIVHAGRLYNGELRGAEEIELNQGGQKSGMISRMDVAKILVELALDERDRRVTFEAFYSDSAQPRDLRAAIKTCEERNVPMKDCIIGKRDSNNHTIVYPTGKEHFSNGNWGNLFTDLENDKEKKIDISEFGSGYI